MNEEKQKLVKETLNNVLRLMCIEATVEEERIEDAGEGKEVYTLSLKTDYPNLLIGQYGSNLQSLQHIVGVIVRKNILDAGEDPESEEDCGVKFNIDVNNYKKQKKESILKLTETIASQVVYNKNSVALRPMSAYERKVVHMEIANRKNLTTESIGENLMRRVIIKYIEE